MSSIARRIAQAVSPPRKRKWILLKEKQLEKGEIQPRRPWIAPHVAQISGTAANEFAGAEILNSTESKLVRRVMKREKLRAYRAKRRREKGGVWP